MTQSCNVGLRVQTLPTALPAVTWGSFRSPRKAEIRTHVEAFVSGKRARSAACFAFTGPPRTGRTTAALAVADLAAELLHDQGIQPTRLVACSGAELFARTERVGLLRREVALGPVAAVDRAMDELRAIVEAAPFTVLVADDVDAAGSPLGFFSGSAHDRAACAAWGRKFDEIAATGHRLLVLVTAHLFPLLSEDLKRRVDRVFELRDLTGEDLEGAFKEALAAAGAKEPADLGLAVAFAEEMNRAANERRPPLIVHLDLLRQAVARAVEDGDCTGSGAGIVRALREEHRSRVAP